MDILNLMDFVKIVVLYKMLSLLSIITGCALTLLEFEGWQNLFPIRLKTKKATLLGLLLRLTGITLVTLGSVSLLNNCSVYLYSSIVLFLAFSVFLFHQVAQEKQEKILKTTKENSDE